MFKRFENNVIFRLAGLFGILTVLAILGATGFMITEGLSFFDALYFTVITISTVGYGDIHPNTTMGKVLAVILVVIGVAIFLGVVASATQFLLQGKQERLKNHRINMLTGVFFSELGNELLNLCANFDAQINKLRQDIIIDGNLIDSHIDLKQKLNTHVYNIDAGKMDIKKVKELMVSKGDQVVRLLENPSFNNNESFTELLRAILHLREELLARVDISDLPGSDVEHLANDLNRVYPLLANHWLNYIYHLKRYYTYLYSLAIRTNPFSPTKSVVVRKN